MTSVRDQRDEARLVAALRSVEIEDLGPSRLELERRRLMARISAQPSPILRRRRVALTVGFAGAAVAAAAVALVVLAPTLDWPGEPSVTLSGVWRLEPGDAISRGLPVRVDEGSRARLVLPDGTSVEASSGARMALMTEDGSAIRLDAGHAVIAVAPRTPPGLFRAVTPDAEVQVHGTVFSVTVDRGSGTTVRLHEGEVRLVCRDRTIAMRPGHQIVATAAGLVSLGVFGEAERRLDAEVAPGHVPPTAEEAGPGLARSGDDPAADPEEAPAPEIANLASAGADDAPGPVAARTLGRPRPAPSIGEQVAEQQRLQHHDAVVELTGGAWERGGTTDMDLLFRRARSLGYLGRWSEAAEVYRRIAAVDTGRRAEALYLVADALRRAGDFAGSAAVADRAIDAGGPNADHAWSVKFGALTGLGRYEDAAEAAEVYLASHPTGAHVGEAHFVRGTSLRLERRWGEAAIAYGRFVERGEGSAAILEDGKFYSGYCLLMSGLRKEGARALEAYLLEHPYGRHARQARAALGR
ncbi:MAG TPA: tetratricopeptide repeat protein [Polyangia bacterium]|nr:tetratricopeptide repeat protein [Polyangia bacterium]